MKKNRKSGSGLELAWFKSSIITTTSCHVKSKNKTFNENRQRSLNNEYGIRKYLELYISENTKIKFTCNSAVSCIEAVLQNCIIVFLCQSIALIGLNLNYS